MLNPSKIRSVAMTSACLALVLAISPAQAGPTDQPTEPLTNVEQGAAKDRLEQVAQTILVAGSKDSPTYGSLASTLNIATDKDDTTATLSVSYNRSHQVGSGKSLGDNATRFSFATESFSVTASAPLGKNSKPSLFDFDTLGDDTSLKFSAVRYASSFTYLPSSNPNSRPAMEMKLSDRCIDFYSSVFVTNSDDHVAARAVAKILRDQIDAMRLANPRMSPGYAVSHLGDDASKDVKALADQVGQKCGGESGPNNGGAGVLDAFLTLEERAAPRTGEPGGIWFIGSSGTVARANYTYLVQSPLAPADVSKTKFKLEGFGGWIFASGRTSLTGSFSYVRTFKEADEIELCQPNGVGSQLSCYTGPLGAPVETKRYTLAGEGRLLLPLGKDKGAPFIGIAPRFSYEFNSKAFHVEVPVYFAPDKGGKLNGGIRFAYDTGQKDFAIGLFIGVPFSIFYN